MLEIAGYNQGLFEKKILENSCGNGQILMSIVRRYIESAQQENKTPNQIKRGLEKNVVGVEIDELQAQICISNLTRISAEYNIKKVKWNIIIGDALKINFPFKFDFIIGNPPYIRTIKEH